MTQDFARRATDASRLTFSLQLVIVIIGGIIATTGAFWVSTSQLRSDMRDLLTHQQDEAKLGELERKLQDERNEAIKVAIAKMEAALRLEEIRNQEMRVTLATMAARSSK